MTVILVDDDDNPYPIVFLQDEQVFGTIVTQGAFASKVKYEKNGVSFEVWVENEDILEED